MKEEEHYLLIIKGESDLSTYALTRSAKITLFESYTIRAAVNRLKVYSRLNGHTRNWERNKDSLYKEERDILEKYIPIYDEMEVHTITSVTLSKIADEEELMN